MFFVCCIVFKIGALTELDSVQQILSPEQQDVFVVQSLTLSFVLSGCVLFSLVLSVVMLVVQMRSERLRIEKEELKTKARRLRLKSNAKEVVVPAIEDRHFHTFLSQQARGGPKPRAQARAAAGGCGRLRAIAWLTSRLCCGVPRSVWGTGQDQMRVVRSRGRIERARAACIQRRVARCDYALTLVRAANNRSSNGCMS